MLTFQIHNMVIGLKAPYLKKPCNLILNQSNIEGWNWKKNFNYTKGLKKYKIKRIRIKIEIQIKFYLWLKSEIENKK
jgi:hypothetical protein